MSWFPSSGRSTGRGGFFWSSKNVPLALKVAGSGYALQVGKVILEGGIDAFKDSDIVKKAYMGG